MQQSNGFVRFEATLDRLDYLKKSFADLILFSPKLKIIPDDQLRVNFQKATNSDSAEYDE